MFFGGREGGALRNIVGTLRLPGNAFCKHPNGGLTVVYGSGSLETNTFVMSLSWMSASWTAKVFHKR